MELLDPSKIRADRSESAEESKKRSQALAIEESRLTRAINQARTDAQREIEAIDDDYKAYKAEKDAERATLERDNATLRAEKTELLKPIDEIKTEAEKVLQTAKEKLSDVHRQAKDLEADREKNTELAETLQDRSDELDHRERKIIEKEKVNEYEIERIKESGKTLGDKWAEFTKATGELNTKTIAVATREAKVEAEHQANEVRQKEFDLLGIEYDQHRKEIANRYEELNRAKKTILGK